MTKESNYILVSLNDEKSKEIAEILGNSTCKKIINYLVANKEVSEKDLSLALNIPINTIEYNLKKLLSSEFIEKTKNFFWSKKGKKITLYRLTNKSVIISHKKSFFGKTKSILPGFILTLAGTFLVYTYEKTIIVKNIADKIVYRTQDYLIEVDSVGLKSSEIINNAHVLLWPWFLVGGLVALIIFLIVNWKKL